MFVRGTKKNLGKVGGKMISDTIVTLTASGAVTIPANVRLAHGLEPGVPFIFKEKGDKFILTVLEEAKWAEYFKSVEFSEVRKRAIADVKAKKFKDFKNISDVVDHLSSLM